MHYKLKDKKNYKQTYDYQPLQQNDANWRLSHVNKNGGKSDKPMGTRIKTRQIQIRDTEQCFKNFRIIRDFEYNVNTVFKNFGAEGANNSK